MPFLLFYYGTLDIDLGRSRNAAECTHINTTLYSCNNTSAIFLAYYSLSENLYFSLALCVSFYGARHAKTQGSACPEHWIKGDVIFRSHTAFSLITDWNIVPGSSSPIEHYEVDGIAAIKPVGCAERSGDGGTLTDEKEHAIRRVICAHEQLKMEFVLWNPTAVVQQIEHEYAVDLLIRGVWYCSIWMHGAGVTRQQGGGQSPTPKEGRVRNYP